LTKKMQVHSLSRTEATAHLNKADQFHRSMLEAVAKGDWDAAGLNAIHCVISANDALLGIRHSVTPAGKSHAEAAEVLRKYETGEEGKRNASRFKRIISKKHLVEYEGRKLTAAEGRKLANDTEKFLAWVKNEVR